MNWPRHVYRGTGQLTLTFSGLADGVRRSWRDGAQQQLENVLREAMTGGIRLAIASRRKREELDATKREIEAKQRERIEADEQAHGERDRREQLLGEAENFERAERLRRYIQAAEERAQTKNRGDLPDDKPLKAWLCWAHLVADSMDPLTDGMNSFGETGIPDEDTGG